MKKIEKKILREVREIDLLKNVFEYHRKQNKISAITFEVN
jgi:hypothetical protein